MPEQDFPEGFEDSKGQEWRITSYRIPGNKPPVRTLIDVQTAGSDYPTSRMITETALRVELASARNVTQPPQRELVAVKLSA